jgi:pSer/pThr/pTyr-binding forkhead associated (FHA) protein
MAAEVRLTITDGISEGRVYAFRKRIMGVLGRGEDCLLRLPDCLATRDVSRRHCLLDIDPPFLYVRDQGSKNGTFVNGTLIGQRERGMPAETVVLDTCEVGLEAGDELRVGGTTFRVSVFDKVRACEKDREPAVDLLEREPQGAMLVG